MRAGLQTRFRQSSGGRTYDRRRPDEALRPEQQYVRQSMPKWFSADQAHLPFGVPREKGGQSAYH